MNKDLAYLYLLSPLHTGGTSQEGNFVGIAREAHTDYPYLPSSTIRGRLRASIDSPIDRVKLFGPELKDIQDEKFIKKYKDATGTKLDQLEQGIIWVGDGSILWFPVPSLSHGVVWVTSDFLLRRWLRLFNPELPVPPVGSFSGGNTSPLYLRDTIFQRNALVPWQQTEWSEYIPKGSKETETISQVLVLFDRDCQVLIQSSLWRQVRVNLDKDKKVDGGFRYEEAISPETLIYFPWGTTTAISQEKADAASNDLKELLKKQKTCQMGGQESLGRGFVELWTAN